MSTSRSLLLFVIQPLGGLLIGPAVAMAWPSSTLKKGLTLTVITVILWIAVVNLICFKVLR